MGRGWRIGRIAGVDINVDPSLAVIAVLIGFSLWNSLADSFRFPGLSPAAAAVLTVLAVLLFFGSILGHELAHAGMSKARHIPVYGITLLMFGGVTMAKIDSRRPSDEFLVTVVGPATSAAIGVVLYALHGPLRAPGSGVTEDALGYVFEWLGVVNLLMAALNLVPGFPLDGGRLLRSIIWKATGSLTRATIVAARSGQVVGGLFIAWGVWSFLRLQDPFALWFALIGWILLQAATATVRDTGRRQVLAATTAGQLMSPPPPVIPPDLSVGDAVERYLSGHEGEAFPVIGSDGLVGFVSLRTARGIPPERPLREALMDASGVVVAGPGERMDAVSDRLGVRGAQTVLVMDGSRLVGVIEPDGLSRFYRSGSPPASPPPPPGAPALPIPPPRPDSM